MQTQSRLRLTAAISMVVAALVKSSGVGNNFPDAHVHARQVQSTLAHVLTNTRRGRACLNAGTRCYLKQNSTPPHICSALTLPTLHIPIYPSFF